MARIRRVILNVKVESLRNINLAGVQDHVAELVVAGFRDKLGPEIVANARGRAPVSAEHAGHGRKSFNPRQAKSFQRIQLRPPGKLIQAREGSIEEKRQIFFTRLHQRGIRGITSKLRAEGGSIKIKGFTQFFQGTRKGGTLGVSPDLIKVKGNTIVGAFKNRSGTLRDSIHLASVERDGDRVIMRIVASAPYAAAVHQGFTHRGGRDHQGKATQIAPKKFLTQTIPDIRSRLSDPSLFQG